MRQGRKAKMNLNAHFEAKLKWNHEFVSLSNTTVCSYMGIADVDKDIKSPIIQSSCTSQRLHRKALRDSTMTLEALLTEARALEVSEQQATDIASPGGANAIRSFKSKLKSFYFTRLLNVFDGDNFVLLN